MTSKKHQRATPEDIALVKKAQEDIKTEASVFSFDIGLMKKRIREDDPAQAFIQAHLYLDHIVTRLLSEHVPYPRLLQLNRTSFSQKLQLVAALGLLQPALIGTVKVVNSIRNKIAHQLDYVVTAEDETKLRSTLPKLINREEDGSLMSLAKVLSLISLMIDLQRQERAFERAMRGKHLANARVVLDDYEAAKSI